MHGRVGAQHVVVGQHVGEAERLDALGVGPDAPGVHADLGLGEHHADPHGAEVTGDSRVCYGPGKKWWWREPVTS